jgi:hypothetical protein
MFNDLLEYQIKNFLDEFRLSRSCYTDKLKKTLIHPGEFGVYREKICKKFLRLFTPHSLAIDTGFIVDANGSISNQCDIIIYDADITPLDITASGFFPVETVVAVGEMKSVIQKETLKEALIKLTNVKRMRQEIKTPSILKRDRSLGISSFDPKANHYDQIFTFLICEKYDQHHKIENEIEDVYKDIDAHLRHNVVLSLENGALLYYDQRNKTLQYPYHDQKKLKHRFVSPTEKDQYAHFKYFCHYFYMAMASTSILYPETLYYMNIWSSTKTIRDQK